jgi:hypothetical protein
MTGEVAGAPGGTVSAAHIVSARLIAVSIPKLRLEQVLGFQARPSILIETNRDYAAAWRLHYPVEPYVAALLAKAIAEALGGEPLPFMLPLPGSVGVGRHYYLKGPANWTLQTDLIRRAPQPAGPAKATVLFRPSAPAVMLGAHKVGGEVFWAPFESEAKLLNSGVLVTGDPGSGKTQTPAGRQASMTWLPFSTIGKRKRRQAFSTGWRRCSSWGCSRRPMRRRSKR